VQTPEVPGNSSEVLELLHELNLLEFFRDSEFWEFRPIDLQESG
jgi:hypothetical protein